MNEKNRVVVVGEVGDEDADLLYRTTLEELKELLLSNGARAVFATAGRHGASIATSGGVRVGVPIAVLPGEVVDTMGAGDATLASTVAHFVSRGVPGDAAGWKELMESAMMTAAATCRTEGALLRRADARPDATNDQ